MRNTICMTAAALILALSVFTAQAIGQGSGNKSGSDSKPTASVSIAPDFSAKDHSGKEHALADYRGKVVVLEWINPGCPFVQRHYKEGTFKALAEKYSDRGVVWLAVNSTNSHGAADNKKWAEAHDLPYPILVDKSGKVGKKYDAKTTPHLFVIGRDGGLLYDGAIDNDPNGDKDKRTMYVKHAIDAALEGRVPNKRETKPYGCSVKYASN